MAQTRFIWDHDKRNSSKEVDVHTDPIGMCPEGRVPVIRTSGERAGHVSQKAGAAVARRFGVGPVKLVGGAWREQPSAMKAALVDAKHATDLAAAKGSVTKHPTKPKTTARPKR